MPRRKKAWRDADPKAQRTQAAKARTAMLAKLGHPAPEKDDDGLLRALMAAVRKPLGPQGPWAPMFSPAALTLSWPSPAPTGKPQPEPEPVATYPEAMVGWREWAVHTADDGTPSLRSLYGDSPGSGILWPHRRRLEAVCDPYHSPWGVIAHHDATCPGWNCTCGIYARSEEEPREAMASVWGQVSLWGKVIRHEKGWRAQYAYPKHLYVDSGLTGIWADHQRLAERLREAYGVPCEVRERVPSLGGPGSWTSVLAGSLRIPAGSPVMVSGVSGGWAPWGKITVSVSADPAPDDPNVTTFATTGYARQSVSWTTTARGAHGHPKLAGPKGPLP